ncbi:DMT family transporter [Brucepastera parasyntrophica]|uniref:DMT family transporter n=1 Tax=Brucepastera parasyntrophica TaxID=2880008 RepID=UPI00210ADF9A|nr:DMT family transporter [Brucepastera parasyntrophica]ULQ58731.1 DMT family transporter [Brucepastera parasyntrophica]
MTFSGNRYLLLAFLTVIVWSATFICTKILLTAFSPIEILLYRFFLAYILMFAVYPRVHKPESLKTEAMIFFAGLSGGTLYFLCENFALNFSLASNVALIVATAPILTAVCAHFFLKNEKLTRFTVLGGVIAFIGVALVIFNGKFVLNLNPLGDILALLSSVSWAVYSILIKKLDSRYSFYYITRKIFFWTLVTVLPFLFIFPVRFDFSPLLDWKITVNLLILSVFASCGAYVAWNKVISVFGATRANNFIYFIPLLTLIESAIILSEPLTFYALLGAVFIVGGVYITGRKKVERETVS